MTALTIAQTPINIKDINPGYESAIPNFDNSNIVFQDKIYFAADDGEHGIELWMTDGTEEGTELVKDINEGTGDSECQNFYIVGGRLLFTANSAAGFELWQTDGTTAGTEMVKDIWPGASSAFTDLVNNNQYFYVWNDVLYFNAKDGQVGWELWRSDGTDSGTFLLKDIHNAFGDLGHSFSKSYAEYNGKLYFASRGPGIDEE